MIKPPKLLLSVAVLGLSFGQFAANADDSKPLKLAFLTNNASDFWTIARAGCETAQKEVPNISVDFRIPADGTAAEQTRIFDDLLVKGTNGIALSPVDPANQTAMIDRGADKSLVVTQDSDAPKSKRSFYVGTDNVAAGRQAGELVKKAIPNGGKIMLFVGKRDAQNAKERIQGLEEALKGSNVSVIDVRTDDTDRVRAKQNVSDTLVKYPDVACLVGLWSYNGPAIANAVKAAGKAGQVKIVCFDEDDETLAGVASGLIYGTVVQQPYEFGKQAITKMDKHLRGDKSALAGGKQIIPTVAIKKDSVTDFQARLKKLLGK